MRPGMGGIPVKLETWVTRVMTKLVIVVALASVFAAAEQLFVLA